MNFILSLCIFLLFTNFSFIYSIYSLNIFNNDYNSKFPYYKLKNEKLLFIKIDKNEVVYYDIKSFLSINIAQGEKKIKNIFPNYQFILSKKLYYDIFYKHYFVSLKESKTSFVLDTHYYFYNKSYALSYLILSFGLSFGSLEANIMHKYLYNNKKDFLINSSKLRSQYFRGINRQFFIIYENSLFKNFSYIFNYKLINIDGKYSSYNKSKPLKSYDTREYYNFRFIHSILLETQFFF